MREGLRTQDRRPEVARLGRVTAKFATGTYVAPSAGRVAVNDVFQSWLPAQSRVTTMTFGVRLKDPSPYRARRRPLTLIR